VVNRSELEVAAWAITQNEKLYNRMDAIAERSVIIELSLGSTYRSEKIEGGRPSPILAHR